MMTAATSHQEISSFTFGSDDMERIEGAGGFSVAVMIGTIAFVSLVMAVAILTGANVVDLDAPALFRLWS